MVVGMVIWYQKDLLEAMLELQACKCCRIKTTQVPDLYLVNRLLNCLIALTHPVASTNAHDTTVSPPLLRASTSVAEQAYSPHAGAHSRSQSMKVADMASPNFKRKDSNLGSTTFKFPEVSPSMPEAGQRSASTSIRYISSKRTESVNGIDQMNSIAKVLSPRSTSGTPRSSGELYTMSNNSTETLASEYPTHDHGRLSHKVSHGRQLSLLGPVKSNKAADVLMMGYGYIMGSFTLDGSLINQNPFEEVKRKGVVGDQGGGGVVRAETAKQETGIFGGLGWGNIGGSFGGLLGNKELSSIKETKHNPKVRSIPILSTPQAVLFVNLQLEPGQTKSYAYNFLLPKGIPPTYKGRAIKISYQLRIGIQRAANITTKNQVHTVDVPFRVLTGVNGKTFSPNWLL